MTWRTISIILAILAALVCIYEAFTGRWWSAVAAGVCAVVFGLEVAGVRTLGRTARVREQNRLRSAPIEDLHNTVRAAVRNALWDRFDAGKAALQRNEWTEAALLKTLDDLWDELMADDRARNRDGRDSNYFEFYDCGLAAIAEALRDRLGVRQDATVRR